MNGNGARFLQESFDILTRQTFTDFDVVVSDHSRDNAVFTVCETYKHTLTIQYLRNTDNKGNSSANINNAIQHAEGTLIKILFQDDFLYDEQSLQNIVEGFDIHTDTWLVTACMHSPNNKEGDFFRPFYPQYNNLIHFGRNTISSPSVLTILNQSPLLFDEHLIWLMDCDYYKRCYNSFGNPKILNTINVVNRVGSHQVTTHIVNNILKVKEFIYILKKYYLSWKKYI